MCGHKPTHMGARPTHGLASQYFFPHKRAIIQTEILLSPFEIEVNNDIYACLLSLDPNTVHPHLSRSKGNREVTRNIENQQNLLITQKYFSTVAKFWAKSF
ncbi:unnamed protein product [Oncorhynchus mykiss]|uniref:Uncharacterized protein n=1 Tax=Oncorhynchus mykiss TaxID=8022 RepID=A0A060VYG9_ONCMY|nr:unnamed protein product [Oncorhynchus mykiss]